MYTRYQSLIDSQTDSVFLFGARQTGKSILLRSLFPETIYIDLLETDTQHRFRTQPSLLRDVLNGYPDNSLVIIDEI
jgi:predicted AAA+ superfamily ATPase